jgi:hypothetical protein
MEYMKEFKKVHQTSVVLHIAFMATLVIYVFIVAYFKGNLQEFHGVMENTNLSWIRYIFYVLGLSQIFIIRFVRESLSKRLISGNVQSLISRLGRISILSSALCELPSFLGLVLFLLDNSTRGFYILAFISSVLFILYFPRYSSWVEWIQTMTRG